jgi:hypothetical protein
LTMVIRITFKRNEDYSPTIWSEVWVFYSYPANVENMVSF